MSQATPAPEPTQASGVSDKVHLRRITIAWLIEMIIMEPIIYFIVWPYIPPFVMTSSARGDQFDALVATMLANGAIAAVILYGIYAVIVWRQRKGDPSNIEGPPIRSHFRVQALWVFITASIVMGAFVFGTYELIVPAGAGTGEGPSPIWTPASKHILPIQVIGQQWVWTYRYPTFGGFETTQLMVPNHTTIAFHVTSLDVIHDWWAYQLSIKADANPGSDNVAFTTTDHQGLITVRCDELCGIWHGAMFDYGHVISQASFEKWGKSMQKKLAPLTKTLPKFSWTYYPSANGAYPSPPYYPPNADPFYKMFQYEYGKSGASGKLPAVHVKDPGAITSNSKSGGT